MAYQMQRTPVPRLASWCANFYTLAVFWLLLMIAAGLNAPTSLIAETAAIALLLAAYVIFAFRRMLLEKHQPAAWMWMGLLGAAGLVVVFLLPDRSESMRGFAVQPLDKGPAGSTGGKEDQLG